MSDDAGPGPGSGVQAEGAAGKKRDVQVTYRQYCDESDLPLVMDLIDNELSEPYSIFTYRYFLHTWPHLCFLAFDGSHCFGVIICKQDMHRGRNRGYLAMLVVQSAYRGLRVGTTLVEMAIREMQGRGCEEVALEAEITNAGALALYRALGFVRDKRLQKYYLNGSDAFRLKLLLPRRPGADGAGEADGDAQGDGAAHAVGESASELIAAEQLARLSAGG